MPTITLALLVLIVFVALAFAFTNGMHDAANSIATLVSTHVLSPGWAVLWAAFFNFAAFLIFGTAVAETIGKKMIDPAAVSPFVVLAGLLGAIAWNLLTWRLGLPTSSSHALIGAYAGAAVANAGTGALIPAGWGKTILFLFMAPALGLVLGIAFLGLASWLVRKKNPDRVNGWFRGLTLLSSALYSLGHGGNDAQKTMGIIASLVLAAGYQKGPGLPLWIVLSAYGALALGTLSGGWRIVKTMGQRITKLRPIDGFCAETASAASIFLATFAGAPISTTHVITGAISGVGTVRRLSAVHWGVTVRIVGAWILTIPAAAFIGAVFAILLRLLIKPPL